MDRDIWIKILGFPCVAWNDVAVNKVERLWGEVCFLEDDIQAPLVVKIVCIKTLKPSLIHEKINIVAQGINYELVGRELMDIVCNDEPLDSEMPHISCDLENEDVLDGFRASHRSTIRQQKQ